MENRIALYHPKYVMALRNFLAEAKSDLREMHRRHLAELAQLRVEVAELRAVLALVVSVSRQQAETDIATLRQRLECALARIERDPAKPLN
jgi:hypothetical protein